MTRDRNAKGRSTGARRFWRQRSVLLIICLVFGGSGLLRIGAMNPGLVAWAAEPAEGEHDPPAAADDAAATPTLAAHDGGAEDGGALGLSLADCPTPASVTHALTDIRARAAELEAQRIAQEDRAATLDAAEDLVAARLVELEAAEARLSDLLAIADTAAATDLDTLTELYETMSAEDAAELFAQMDPSFAAGFIARMAPDAGARLLAQLDPTMAYAISVILATRNAEAPISDIPVSDSPEDQMQN